MEKLVLIEDQVFLVTDALGDMPFGNGGGLGLYYLDTRFLSVFEFTINGVKPTIMSGSGEQNFMGNIQLANPALHLADGHVVKPSTISIRRNRFIDAGLEERIGLLNYNRFPVEVELVLVLAADFKDMFEVRGITREANGKVLLPTCGGQVLEPLRKDSTVSLNYLGLDGVRRRTDIVFELDPASVELIPGDDTCVTLGPASGSTLLTSQEAEVRPAGVKVTFQVRLDPHKPFSLTMYVTPAVAEERPHKASFDVEARELRESYERWVGESAVLETDNELFNRMLRRGQTDLRGLMTFRPTGPFPTAGIPWFAAPFGRDALITSLQTMILSPAIAVGTLRFLALHQGREVNDWRDEQPGKIMHEIRVGEMAVRGQVPHSCYYGSVDSTPLFLILFAEAMDWLDDDGLYEELLPAVTSALHWVDTHGDLDGDGYVEYKTLSSRGLYNQAWKDSKDAYAFPTGELAEQPIAATEVQGYVYEAKTRLAALFRRKGEAYLAEKLASQAIELRDRFNRDFWLEEESFFGQALDGRKQIVPSITSNPAHCLWSGIVDPERARAVAERLLHEDLFSGWGIRTLSSNSPNFNPMSYHNGSIWPHDNSIAAAGLRRYGFDQHASDVITGIFLAGLRFRYTRLPELFSGFARDLRYLSMPAEYPASCSPQAWAAGAPIYFLHTMLGMRADAANHRLHLRPYLPDWLNEVSLRGLRFGRGRVDLLINRNQVHVVRNEGDLEVSVDDLALVERLDTPALTPSCMQKMPFFV